MPPSDSSSRRWFIAIRAFVLLAAVAVFMFLAWRSSPWFTEIHWMPRSLSRWSDRHGVARNVVGFFGFGLIVFTFAGRRWPQVIGTAVFATGLEVAQIWIPSRQFDRKDIVASLLGLALAWVAIVGATRLFRLLKPAC